MLDYFSKEKRKLRKEKKEHFYRDLLSVADPSEFLRRDNTFSSKVSLAVICGLIVLERDDEWIHREAEELNLECYGKIKY